MHQRVMKPRFDRPERRQVRNVTRLLARPLSGTIFYSLEEGWSIVDAFYVSVTTLTTVGLGDFAPTTTLGKLFTVIYIFAGLSLVLGFIDTVAKETFRSRTRGQGSGEDREDAPGS